MHSASPPPPPLQSAQAAAVAREDELVALQGTVERLQAEAKERQDVLNSLRRDGCVTTPWSSFHVMLMSHAFSVSIQSHRVPI
jgi:hypothetical protein